MGAAAVPLATAGASVAGSIIGGNAQESAAQDQANEQTSLSNAQIANLNQNEANYRSQVSDLLPYLTGMQGAASGVQSANNYLAPSSGASTNGIFGGQMVQSTPGSGNGLFGAQANGQSAPSGSASGFLAGNATPPNMSKASTAPAAATSTAQTATPAPTSSAAQQTGPVLPGLLSPSLTRLIAKGQAS